MKENCFYKKLRRDGITCGCELDGTKCNPESCEKYEKKEVIEVAKKIKGNKVKKLMTTVAKPSKAGKVCIEYSLISPLMASGEPVKVKDILTKITVAKTNCSPYFRVYSTLEKATKQGLVKNLGKGTFQLVKKSEKSEVPL